MINNSSEAIAVLKFFFRNSSIVFKSINNDTKK